MRSVPVTFIEGIVKELGNGADLERLLEEHKMGPTRMMQLMDTRCGKRVLKARRRLGRIQRELLGTRFSPFAVNKLIAVLQGVKEELWLRAATQVLEVAEGNKTSGGKARPRGKEEQRVFDVSQAEGARMLRLMALGAEVEREAARQGARAKAKWKN